MDEPPRAFGEVLRDLRRSRSLSLRALERQSNFSKSLLGSWELGPKTPSPEDADRLDHILDAGGELIAAAAAAVPVVTQDRIASEVVRHFAHQGPVAAEIRRRAELADRLDVLAIRGLGILGLNDSLLRPALAARDEPLRVRVLLLDPDSDAAGRRAAEIGESQAAFVSGIKFTLARLEEASAAAVNLDLCVALYATLPIWRIIRADDVMWVSSFAPDWEGHESTVYEIPRTPKGSFWAGYTRHFDDLNDHSRRVL